jgi:FtsP/CotA-like multicopper oxidase with cupredoxin domain
MLDWSPLMGAMPRLAGAAAEAATEKADYTPIVAMNHPGIWAMGDLADDDRGDGMGIVVEYSGRQGKPQWTKPQPFHWDYARFGRANTTPASPDEMIEMTIVKHNAALNGFSQWTLNGEAFSTDTMKPMFTLNKGRRYRLKFHNASDDIHPLHLHWHSFELTRLGGKPTAGVIKDVVMLGGFQELEFDFVADNAGGRCFTVISNCTWISGSWRFSITNKRR